jgi:hypothetical protein
MGSHQGKTSRSGSDGFRQFFCYRSGPKFKNRSNFFMYFDLEFENVKVKLWSIKRF